MTTGLMGRELIRDGSKEICEVGETGDGDNKMVDGFCVLCY